MGATSCYGAAILFMETYLEAPCQEYKDDSFLIVDGLRKLMTVSSTSFLIVRKIKNKVFGSRWTSGPLAVNTL